MACLVEGMGSIDSQTHTQEDCVEGDLGTLKLFAQYTALLLCLAGFVLAASYFFITSHTAEYPM
eukprot:1146726-Pelagomonas_calceolata.AAC.2